MTTAFSRGMTRLILIAAACALLAGCGRSPTKHAARETAPADAVETYREQLRPDHRPDSLRVVDYSNRLLAKDAALQTAERSLAAAMRKAVQDQSADEARASLTVFEHALAKIHFDPEAVETVLNDCGDHPGDDPVDMLAQAEQAVEDAAQADREIADRLRGEQARRVPLADQLAEAVQLQDVEVARARLSPYLRRARAAVRPQAQIIAECGD